MMKAIVLLCMVVLAIPPPIVANAAKGDDKCKQILNDLDKAVQTINDDTTSYWASRARFVDLIFSPSSDTIANPPPEAEQEKSKAKEKKDKMPGNKKSFDDLITAAKAQDCLSPTELSAIVEPTTKHAKRVNFDQFPPEEPFQSKTDRGPPSMPRN
jgi:hypothetical protein